MIEVIYSLAVSTMLCAMARAFRSARCFREKPVLLGYYEQLARPLASGVVYLQIPVFQQGDQFVPLFQAIRYRLPKRALRQYP